MKDVKGLLDELEATAEGKSFLINLRDCCEDVLVSKVDVISFFAECAVVRTATPTIDAVSLVRQVAERTMDGTTGEPRFLRLCKQPTFGLHGRRLSNTTTFTSFVRYHIDKTAPKLGVRIPSIPPPTTGSGMDRLARDIAKLTSKAGWHHNAATLGLPLPTPSNCWITVDDFTDRRRPPAYDPSATAADRMRDALGLIDRMPGEHLVTYTFDADPAAATPGVDIARPTFADLGNRRFRAKHTCKRGRAMAAAGWGCTVHLARLASPPSRPVSGRPERVTRSMKIVGLRALHVDYLRAVTVARGGTSDDDDNAFVAVTSRGRSLAKVKQKILRFLSK